MRQISLDTETTGLFYYQGHRIIEIGCVEILNKEITKNTFHSYINPERDVEKEAKKITGLTENFLKNKPLFKDVVDNFFKFIENADEIIIHNAAFDINFINNELKILNYKIKNIKDYFKIFDTLDFARKLYPGKKNNLNALCERYNISTLERTQHGALLDATLLAKVYIEMTSNNISDESINYKKENTQKNNNLEILKANKQEIISHINYIKLLKNQSKTI